MPFPFFFSHAREDRRGNDLLTKFFDDLCGDVRGLAGANVGNGFIDDHDIEPGEDWRVDLVDALVSIPILVCIYSPTYFQRDYCGKEVEIFLQRRRLFLEQSGGKEPGFVVPVLWQPSQNRIPRTLPSLQWAGLDDTRFKAEDFGLYYALRTGKEEYKDVVYKLALRIRNLLQQPRLLPALPSRPKIDGVPNAFNPPRLPLPRVENAASAGPTSVTFVYPANPKIEDWPFAPPASEIAIAQAAAIAKGKDLQLHGIEFDPADGTFLERVERAVNWKSIVILMLSGASLENSQMKASLQKADSALSGSALATMVIWNKEPRRNDFSDILPNLQRGEFFYGGIGNIKGLDAAVRQSLGGLQNRLAMQGPPGKNAITDSTSFEKVPGF
jgi:hypothetical protein